MSAKETPLEASEEAVVEAGNNGTETVTTNGKDSGAHEGTVQKKKNPLAGKKVSEEILLKRKLGRIKAAESMAKKIKNSGIEKVENHLANSTFRSTLLINQKNYYTDYLKKDDQISFLRKRKELFGIKKGRKSNIDKQKELKEKLLLEKNDTKSSTPLDIDEDEDEDNEEEDTVAAESEADAEKRAKGLETIAIHPGSKNIRIGFVNTAYPKTFANVIAVPNNKEAKKEIYPVRDPDAEPKLMFGEKFSQAKKTVQKDFKERMRYYKRRILPNSNETVRNFNKKVQSEVILDLNDPHKIDWIKNDDASLKGKKYIVGDKALKLENQSKYRLRYPIVGGKFNESPEYYKSPSEVVGDIQLILTELLQSEFNISSKNFRNYNIVLVIPDLYDKTYVETWISLILQLMSFNAISVLQESVAATFGAGVSQACVIDIGAQTTTVSCIDEGMIINDSRIRLDYGGDDITNVFAKLLLQSNFPFSTFNLDRLADWQLINSLKERYTTFQDANIAIQLYDFIKRIPYEKTEKFQFKIFDEVMLSPMGLFYPEIMQLNDPNNLLNRLQDKRSTNMLFPVSIDSYTGKPNNPTSLSLKNCLAEKLFTDQSDEDIIKDLILTKPEDLNINNVNLQKNKLSREEALKISDCKLDLAIIESITNACKNDINSSKKFYENLLIVGGVAKTPSLDLILTDRINIWRPRILSVANSFELVKKISDEFNSRKQTLSTTSTKNPESTTNSSVAPDGDINDIESSHSSSRANDEINDDMISLLDSIIQKHLAKLSDNAVVNSIEVLSPPRDLDPQILTWKGASVFARLKIVHELWITENDWELLGNRALHYKALFSY